MRLEKWVAGRLVAAQEHTVHGDFFMKNELLLMLQVAGFRQVAVCGGFADEPVTLDSEELVFTAIK